MQQDYEAENSEREGIDDLFRRPVELLDIKLRDDVAEIEARLFRRAVEIEIADTVAAVLGLDELDAIGSAAAC